MCDFYFADFETTYFDEQKGVRVYLWCMVRGNEQYHGESVKSFYEFLKNKKMIIYFHNLNFDFSFLQYYFLKNNIEYEILEKNGNLYSVKFGKIELRDSLNFLPMTLKEVGELYCKTYKKTSIEYEVPFSHKATKKEIEYCFNDCRVLEEGLTTYLTEMQNLLEENLAFNTSNKVFKKLTNAGIAFDCFKEFSEFKKIMPKTTRVEYELFSPAYKGGFVFSNNIGILKNVKMIDCNSMYPFIYSTKFLPFGKPKKIINFKLLKNYKFYILNIEICYNLKDGKIATIGGGIGKYGNIIYKKTSNGLYENMTICNHDFDLILKFYDCDYKINWAYGFQTKKGIFEKYCKIFLKIKNENKGIKRNIAKVMLNSPYGKSAMNGINEIRTYFLKNDIITSELTGYNLDEQAYQYLPLAIAITAQARKHLLLTAEQIGFENVIYMDTDSIKFTGDFNIKTDSKILGAWKNEGTALLFRTIAPKKYIYYAENKKINIVCAGFNKSIMTSEFGGGKECEIEEALRLVKKFHKGLKINCLQSKIVKGGRALINVQKEIK